jgi:ribonuclease HI
MPNITIYTDGAAKGNPGRGGYGTILISGTHQKELSQGFKNTTNNRMELMAVIVGLEALKTPNCNVTIVSDSKYVVDSIEKKWVFGWVKSNFKGKKNADLWKRFLLIYPKHQIKMQWIKGHNGHFYNEKCDALAVKAAESNNLLEDEGYVFSSED